MFEPHFSIEQKIRGRLSGRRVHRDESKRANAVHQDILGNRGALGLEGGICQITLDAHINSDSGVTVVPDELDAVLAAREPTGIEPTPAAA